MPKAPLNRFHILSQPVPKELDQKQCDAADQKDREQELEDREKQEDQCDGDCHADDLAKPSWKQKELDKQGMCA